MDRNSQIIHTSWIGIVANVLLAAFKAIVGFISGSVAIIMDAVNNLSDALSSVITIVGTKLSQRYHCHYRSLRRHHLVYRIS